MSPALDAATQTTVPTVRMAARAEGSVQPQATKTTATPRSVTSVMPEVGLEETPISPTMREETTTKASPKIATPTDATRRGSALISPASSPGTRKSVRTTTAGTATVTQGAMSRSVRGTPPSAAAAPDPRRPLMTATRDAYIVGSVRITVTIPAAATAPAPT